MIEYLRIERWRAYQHLELELEPGTTFVVARNGIGKTSLLEAAAFAVTGNVGPGSVVRAGSLDAEVEARIRLPDESLLSVTRRLENKGRKPEVSTSATLDGVEVADVQALLESAWKAPLAFVARTAFIHESLHAGGVEGVRDQLARAFGVEDLQAALSELDVSYSELSKQTTSADRQIREESADRAAIVSTIATAETLLANAIAVRDAARASLNETETAEKRRDEGRRDVEGHMAWIVARDELVNDVARLSGGEVAPPSLAATVRQLDERAQAELTELRSRIIATRTRLSIVSAAAEELARAGSTCPVCRRPLDEASHADAAEGHRAEIDELTSLLASMDESELEVRATSARHIADRLVRLGEEPQVSTVNDEQTLLDSDAARGAWQAAVEAAAVAQAAFDRAMSSLAEVDANEQRTEELRGLYRELALLEASREAIGSTVHRILSERVDPMLAVIRQRWKMLFPDRPDLRLDIDGKFSRMVGGVDLQFDAFSTGERAAAQLLLRLVLVEATTRVGMCWVDEPLEHLDPTSRRMVGSMLAQAATAPQGGSLNLRQLFVTTYEEPLARRIAEFIDDAHLVYVTALPAE
jgi:DNA repair exonuclease SbcCD ATPase subunit